MAEDRKLGIDAGAIGKGFLTGCGSSCLTSILFIILVLAAGIPLTKMTPESLPAWISITQLLAGLVVNVVVGFFTARWARRAKLLNAGIIGVIWIIIGALVLVVSARFSPKPTPTNPLTLLAFVAAVPMSLVGGWLAISLDAPDDKKPDQNKPGENKPG